MGPMIADLIVLLQKNRQACFGKDVYREPRVEELLPWEKVLQQQQRQRKRPAAVEDGDENNINIVSSPSPSSRMAISRTP